MYIFDGCLEEIALEGLDGITLNSLWIRLSNRGDFNLDYATKEYLWRYIRQHKQFTFYLLPEQRPDISINKNDDVGTETVGENDVDLYPLCLINQGWGPKDDPNSRVFGSCRFYEVRKDVTNKVKSTQIYESLEYVINQFGNLFVVVASTEVRVKALIGTNLDVTTFIAETIQSPVQYCCLERIGRSRLKGESSLGKNPLQVAFKMRPKDMFYVLSQLERFGVIKKQTYSLLLTSRLRHGSLSTLTRFASPSEPNFYFGKMMEMILFLNKQPEKKAQSQDIRNALNVERKGLKKLLQTYPGVIDRVRINEPNARFFQYFENQQQQQAAIEVEESEEDSSDDDTNETPTPGVKKVYKKVPPKATIVQKYYQLSDKVVFNEETGEWKQLNDEEDENSDEDAEAQQTDWLQQNPYRTKLYELLRIIREAKSNGVVVNDLRKKLSLKRKQTDRLLNNIKKTDLIKTVMLNVGKYRRTLYVWGCEQHESGADFEKFNQLSGIKLEDATEKEKLMLGERNIRRMNMMLLMIENSLVLQRFQLLKEIKASEKEEGYKFEMDRKCLISLVDFLAAHGAIKCYTTVLTSNQSSFEKEINFVAHRSVDQNNETLRMHIASLKQAFGHAKNKKPLNEDQQNVAATGLATVRARKRKLLSFDNEPSKEKKPRAGEYIMDTEGLAGDVNSSLVRPFSTVKGIGKRRSINDPSPEEVTNIMTYTLGAQENYGLQGKFVRCQVLHEFLYYWLITYKGNLVQRSTLSKNEDEREPDVYLDEESWKRYVPPPPPLKDSVSFNKWFLLSDLIACLPVSLIAMTCNNPYKVDGLDEILSHPKKKFYLLCQIPRLISLALQRDRRIVQGLAKNCMILCALGILSLGPAHASYTIYRTEDTYFYLHESTTILDTSTTPYRFYHVAQPLSRYQEYCYDLTKEENIELYWLHFRAISYSSRMGHRNCKTEEDVQLEKGIKAARKTIKDLCQIKRINFDQTSVDGKPVEPRTGAGGYHPILVIFRLVNWKLNRCPVANWFYDEMRRRMVFFEKEIAKRVASLSLSWNTFLNVTSDQLKTVTRSTYKSPFAKSSRHILRNPRPEINLDTNPSQLAKSRIKKRRNEQFLDNTDRISYESKRRLRSKFSLKEGQTMLLARAVSLIVCPNQRMWVNPTCVRDLMHKYVPESRDKTSKSMLQRSAREIYDNQASYDSMMMMMNQLKKNQDIKAIKKCYPMISFCSPQQKSQLYTELFDKAIEIFSSGSSMLINKENIENVLENFSFVYDIQGTGDKQSQDVNSLDSIYESTVFNTYLSLLSLSRRDGTFSGQLHDIYKGFPRDKMNSVVSQLRRDGLIVTVLPHRVWAKHTREQQNSDETTKDFMPAAGGLRRHLTFSYFYRHFFYHKFHINLTEQAVNFYEMLRKRCDDYHNILQETPGFLPVLVNLICQDQIDIKLKLPDVIVAFPDDNSDLVSLESLSNKKLRPESDTDEDGLNMTQKPLSTSGLNLNKTFLYKLRYERLQAVEKSDFRSINMRLSSCGLNPSEIVVKFQPSSESFDAPFPKKMTSKATEKLLYEIPTDVPNWNEYKNLFNEVDFKSNMMQIYQTIASYNNLGIREIDLRECYKNLTCFDSALQQLLNDFQIIKCGSVSFRYVAREYSAPWTVASFKMPKELRSAAADAEIVESKGIPVTFLPRPWIRPDCSLNRPMLKWLCEGIFLRLLSMPGITENDICEQFNIVLQPTSIKDLLEYMLDIGCIVKRVDNLFQREPTLFGWTAGCQKTLVSYHVAIDGITKLAALFTKTSLPDFCSLNSSGNESLKQQRNLFSRR